MPKRLKKCSSCGRRMKSVRPWVTHVFMMDQVAKYTTYLCVTCRRERRAALAAK